MKDYSEPSENGGRVYATFNRGSIHATKFMMQEHSPIANGKYFDLGEDSALNATVSIPTLQRLYPNIDADTVDITKLIRLTSHVISGKGLHTQIYCVNFARDGISLRFPSRTTTWMSPKFRKEDTTCAALDRCELCLPESKLRNVLRLRNTFSKDLQGRPIYRIEHNTTFSALSRGQPYHL